MRGSVRGAADHSLWLRIDKDLERPVEYRQEGRRHPEPGWVILDQIGDLRPVTGDRALLGREMMGDIQTSPA
jgi:hypothetical protein